MASKIPLILLTILTQAAIYGVVGDERLTVDISGLTIHDVPCDHEHTNCRCNEDADVCEFELVIEKRDTFTRYAINQELNEQGVQGSLYYFNDSGNLVLHPFADRICADIPFGDPRCTDPETVDAATFRTHIAVNGRFPGYNLYVPSVQLRSSRISRRCLLYSFYFLKT